MKRQHQAALIALTLGLSWLAMQIVHECGHVLAAWATGGRIAAVGLHPTAVSYTLLAANPRPVFVAWMGPIVGVTVPLLASLVARRQRVRGWYVWQFFVGFCLVANGAYLAGGAVYEMGDAGELVRLGAGKSRIYMFALPTFFLGLWLWNGLGPHFGLSRAGVDVDRGVTFVVLLLLLAVVALELAFA